MNLHYGCGLMCAPGWYNCDASPTLRLQRLPLVGAIFRRVLEPVFPAPVQFGDIVRGLSIPTGSCDAAYCSHVLEHLSLDDCRLALRNTFSYLKQGGLFRMVLPDFEQFAATYLSDPDADALFNFFSSTHLGQRTRPKGIQSFISEYLGNTRHLWMWDYKSLVRELQSLGFTGMRRCHFGDSANPAFLNVENTERFECALAIECTK